MGVVGALVNGAFGTAASHYPALERPSLPAELLMEPVSVTLQCISRQT